MPNLFFRRDAVAPGDDLTDKDKFRGLEVSDSATLEQIIQILKDSEFLPPISGGRATWIIRNAQPLAVITQQDDPPRFLVDPKTPQTDLYHGGSYYCEYWCQKDPDFVFSALKNHMPLPTKYRE